MLKDLKEYKIDDRKYARYVCILDEDPKRAASSLTKQDLKSSYELLKEVFAEHLNKNIKHEILYDTLTDSRNNYLWFLAFFKEIEKLLDVTEKFKFPFLCHVPQGSGLSPTVLQPFSVGARDSNGFYKLSYKKTNTSDSPINNYRTLYVMAEYDMSDFFGDTYPEWYVFDNTVLFEQYNEKTNKRVRITFSNGELSYYMAGASDNWLKIPNVPKEMDYVISALIFRHSD